MSHWQRRVNWPQVAGSDAKFAIAKATDGTSSDDRFKYNWSGIQEAGLFRGAYHFAHPGTDAETQAVHFASVVGPLGFRDLPPALDLERADGKSAVDWPGTFFVWPRTPAVSGSAVKAWQTRMIQRQFPIDADGVYGPQSKNACLAFQRNQGLVRDGIVGQTTWDATFAADTNDSA